MVSHPYAMTGLVEGKARGIGGKSKAVDDGAGKGKGPGGKGTSAGEDFEGLEGLERDWHLGVSEADLATFSKGLEASQDLQKAKRDLVQGAARAFLSKGKGQGKDKSALFIDAEDMEGTEGPGTESTAGPGTEGIVMSMALNLAGDKVNLVIPLDQADIDKASQSFIDESQVVTISEYEHEPETQEMQM
jgi:hypothetical protein